MGRRNSYKESYGHSQPIGGVIASPNGPAASAGRSASASVKSISIQNIAGNSMRYMWLTRVRACTRSRQQRYQVDVRLYVLRVSL